MSTDFYLCCRIHKQYVHAANIGATYANGPCFEKHLGAFVASHKNCNVMILDEHQLDDFKYGITYSHEVAQEWHTDAVDPFVDILCVRCWRHSTEHIVGEHAPVLGSQTP